MRIRHLIIAAALVTTAAIAAPAAGHAATGDLTQKADPDGCIVDSDGAPVTGCTNTGKLLEVASSVTVSPDGTSAYVAAFASGAVAIFDREVATGKLTQKTTGAGGSDGCIVNFPTTGCTTGKALDGASSVTVSPDGTSVYVASFESDAVAIFDRDIDGKLTQKTTGAGGSDGCIVNEPSTDVTDCTNTGKALDGASSVTVSPDGASVYVTSAISDAVAIFDRDIDGKLTQKTTGAGGSDGCIVNEPSTDVTDCTNTGKALDGASSVTVSLDDATVYVASDRSHAVAIFDRDIDGKLTQKTTGAGGSDGCIVNEPSTDVTDCTNTGKALRNASSVTVSPDGASAYVASRSNDAVAIFDRDVATGKLTQKTTGAGGSDGCIVNEPSPDITGCTNTGKALDGASSVTVSPDGASAYVASETSDAIAVFDRDTATGKLIQTADPDGCILDSAATPIAGCTIGKELEGVSSVTVSPDGASAYVASPESSAVAIFDRELAGIAPATTINSGPQGPTNPSPSFGFTSNEPSTFDCRLNEGPFAACSSPKAYSALADGPYTFAVRATDTDGNTDPTPAERSFTVDTTLDGSASAKKTQKQKGSKIKVKVNVSAGEDLSAEGSGKVKVGKKSYKLKPKATDVAAGAKTNLTLKPKKSKDRKKIAKALKKGTKAKAKLTVKMTDELGNSESTKLSVKLKG